MMSDPMKLDIDRWLRAEGRARAEDGAPSAEAEREIDGALGSLFASLPGPLEVPADFAARVMNRIALSLPEGVPLARDRGRGARAATAAALTLVAFAAFWLLPMAAGALARMDLAGVVGGSAAALAAALVAGGNLLEWLSRLAGLGRALWLLASSPQIAPVLVTSIALAALLGRFLQLLLEPGGPWGAAQGGDRVS
ncbi:MAG: hypothetical protein AAF725_06935 [Acidobacteriota bacterium]